MLPGHHAGIATTGRVWWLRKVRGLSAALPLYRAAATGREWRHYLHPPSSNSSDAASYTHSHDITEMQTLYKRHLDK
jgi:hypothetical protein